MASATAMAESVNYEGQSKEASDWKTQYGGTLLITAKTPINWNQVESINFSKNNITGINNSAAYGGAIAINASSLTINESPTVNFKSNNAISSNGKAAQGGAIYLYGSNALLDINNCASVCFENNYTESDGNQCDYDVNGGAVKNINGTTVNIKNNSEVSFINNYVNNNRRGRAVGGAIDTRGLTISGNTKVSFTGNHINAITNNPPFPSEENISKGGAIYSSSSSGTDSYLQLRDNSELTIQGNYIHTVDTREGREKNEYVLNGIYTEANRSSGVIQSYSHLNLSTAGTATICDGTVVEGNLNINESYEGKAQNGKVILTGAYTESDLNAIIAANTAEGETARTATEAEITASRTHSVLKAVTVYAGTLSVQAGAILKAAEGIIVKDGATLEVVNADSASAYALSLAEAATTIPAASVLDADLILEDNAALTIVGGPVDMNGHSVTIGNDVSITMLLNTLEGVEGTQMTLFNNEADGAVSVSSTAKVLLTDGTTTMSATYTDNLDGSITITATEIVPEPTTATLSLLALAALAARRRRR